MKKIVSFLLTFTLFISFSGCSNKDDTTPVSETAAITRNNSTTTAAETAAGTNDTSQATTEAPQPEVQLEIEIVNNTVCKLGGTFIMAVKNDGQTISNYEDIPVMNDVRSIYCFYDLFGMPYFYIKNDNTLWTYGDNEYGQLGDGTGVNSQEGSEPVKILDNVANIYVYSNTIFAVTYEKELYGWGHNNIITSNERIIFGNSENAVYAPFKIMDDVVDMPELGYVIKSDATLWTWDKGNILANPYENEQQKYENDDIMPITKIADNVKKYTGNYTWIETDNTLIYGEVEKESNSQKINPIALSEDVTDVFSTGNTLVFLKTDGTLWGKGKNTNGQLGDGTKVDKSELVKIADNAKAYYFDDSGIFGYLLNDGTCWTWDSSNPVPAQKYSEIYEVIRFYSFEDYLISENGELFCYNNYNEAKEIIFENVKLS